MVGPPKIPKEPKEPTSATQGAIELSFSIAVECCTGSVAPRVASVPTVVASVVPTVVASAASVAATSGVGGVGRAAVGAVAPMRLAVV